MRTKTISSTALRVQIESLRHMTVGQLKAKYQEVFGEVSRSNHKQFLFQRIAWRMQANAYGGLSERACRHALEIADDADLRIRAPRNFLKADLDESRTLETRVAPTADPAVGTLLQVMTDREAPAASRARAADVVLRTALRGMELEDLEARLDRLERSAETNGGRRFE